MVTIDRVAADSPDARALMRALDADLAGRYPEAHAIHGLHDGDAANPRLIVLVARLDGAPAACGAVRELAAQVGELKRMFVVPERRGQKLARALLEALEAHAIQEGYTTLRIETGTRQHEAVALYRSAGYLDIAPFGVYVGNPYSVCFETRLEAGC
jgi:putative acetyltransferase